MSTISTDFAFNINQMMEEHSIQLSYTGEFNIDLINVLLGLTKGSIQMGSTQKKVYNIMIESLENLVRHASKSLEFPYPAIFILAKNEKFYYVCTGNKIHNQDVPALKEKLKKANHLNKEELREWYNQVLVNGEIPSDTRGAGLGIIDMAIKSTQPFHFEFTPMSLNNCFFVLKIMIPVN